MTRPPAASASDAAVGTRPREKEGDEDRGGQLEVGKLLISTALLIALLVAGMAALAHFFGPTLASLGKHFVALLGGPGVALGYLLPDALTVPIPADVVAAFGLFGGMPFAVVATWGAVGSLIGGSLGWFIGLQAAQRWPRLARRIDEDERVVPFLRRHGASVLALAAVTPLPYSIGCWGAGAIRMPFATFFAVSLLRVPRVALYLWLVQEGVVATGAM